MLNAVVVGAATASTVAFGANGIAHADTNGHDIWKAFEDQDDWDEFDADVAALDHLGEQDSSSDLHTFSLPTHSDTFSHSSTTDRHDAEDSEYQGRHRTHDSDSEGSDSEGSDSDSRDSTDSDSDESPDDSDKSSDVDEFSDLDDVSELSVGRRFHKQGRR
jgi:hypothetical protein